MNKPEQLGRGESWRRVPESILGAVQRGWQVVGKAWNSLYASVRQFFSTPASVHLNRLLASLSRLSTRLYLVLGGALVLTALTSLIAVFSFTLVGNEQQRVNENVPGMVVAFQLARQANSLAAAAPRLTAASSREDFVRARDAIAADRALFERHLGELLAGHDAAGSTIRANAAALIDNIQQIEDSVSENFTLSERSQELALDLTTLRGELERQMAEAIDDQFFYTITGYRQLDRPAAERDTHFSETEFQRFRNLMELESASSVGSLVLTSVPSVADRRQLAPLLERFEAAAANVNRSLNRLVGTNLLTLEEANSLGQLVNMGVGAAGSFDLQERVLTQAERQQELLAENRELVARLTTSIETHVGNARALTSGATETATDTISTAGNLLLWINLLSIVGALSIGWFYVQPLVERIKWLSERMRGMAAGDLKDEVDMPGRDEVAEMADALEVFRRSSLEAQRLNLVEELAEELRGKNDELEKVLGELRQAQDQIVMREKLAALGELTAGVAHEIKNPLNFVKNFAEGSMELLQELRDVLGGQEGEGGGDLTAEQRQLLSDIGADLNENLTSILRNGDRANRIVQDMLSMGRGSGDFHRTDINRLVMEHANLAFHAARATDPDFQLTITDNLDPDAGEINVIPNDIGRVFLNMVNNACHATDEKRRRIEAETGQRTTVKGTYQPTLEIRTSRGENSVVICIRDNGDGIPPELVEKIFNPFFTTKPTDKGTGLGLSLSSDIVREHGGSIRVESEPGEFTEMQVELPLEPAAADEDTPPEDAEGGSG